MTAHKHAALMAQYAQDWAETDKPWKRWEVAAPGNKFVSLFSHPYWSEKYEYRRKPRMMTYTVTMPEPLREAPGLIDTYWLAQLSGEYCTQMYWHGREWEWQWLNHGLCFATKEDAIAAAKAMLPIKGEEA